MASRAQAEVSAHVDAEGEGFGARSVAYISNSSPSQMRFKESTLMS
jgi:hypothetical protein